jgi:hypothetical protein
MKKFLASILAVLYLSTSLGATIHFHYCMGKLVAWGLVNHESRNCDYCGMPKYSSYPHQTVSKNNCCKDEQHQLKADRDQKITQAEIQLFNMLPDVAVFQIPSFNSPGYCPVTLAYPRTNAPPDTGSQPAFLLNCNFRI